MRAPKSRYNIMSPGGGTHVFPQQLSGPASRSVASTIYALTWARIGPELELSTPRSTRLALRFTTSRSGLTYTRLAPATPPDIVAAIAAAAHAAHNALCFRCRGTDPRRFYQHDQAGAPQPLGVSTITGITRSV